MRKAKIPEDTSWLKKYPFVTHCPSRCIIVFNRSLCSECAWLHNDCVLQPISALAGRDPLTHRYVCCVIFQNWVVDVSISINNIPLLCDKYAVRGPKLYIFLSEASLPQTVVQYTLETFNERILRRAGDAHGSDTV